MYVLLVLHKLFHSCKRIYILCNLIRILRKKTSKSRSFLYTIDKTIRRETVRTKLVAKMFPDESRGTKDSDSQIGVGLAATRASFVQSSFRDSRHEQVRLVVLRRRGTERAVGGTKGSSCNAGRRTGGNNRTSYCETGGGGSSQHRGGLCNESLSSFSFVLSIDESSFGNRCTGVVDSVSSCRVSDSIATLSTRAVKRRALS